MWHCPEIGRVTQPSERIASPVETIRSARIEQPPTRCMLGWSYCDLLYPQSLDRTQAGAFNITRDIYGEARSRITSMPSGVVLSKPIATERLT